MFVLNQQNVLILLVILIFLYMFVSQKEGFGTYYPFDKVSGRSDIYKESPNRPIYLPRYDLPYYDLPFNAGMRSTRGMSYDLRGDVPITQYPIGPWNVSSWSPVQNKPLYLIS